MAINIDAEFNKLAKDLERLYKDELTRQGLVESGKLKDSISVVVVKTPQGYTLQMSSLDYFKYLDEKYKITENVLKSSQYQRIQDSITNIYVQITLDEL